MIFRTPENCAYTGCDKSASINAPPTSKKDYFNSGLIVLEPSKAVFDSIVQTLMATPDPNAFRFPDQDFLNGKFQSTFFFASTKYQV